MKPLPPDDETLTKVQETFHSKLVLIQIIVSENILKLCLELDIGSIPFEFVGGGCEHVLQRLQH